MGLACPPGLFPSHGAGLGMPSSTDTDLSRKPNRIFTSPHTQVCERRSNRLTHRWIQEPNSRLGALGTLFLSCRNNHHTDKTSSAA